MTPRNLLRLVMACLLTLGVVGTAASTAHAEAKAHVSVLHAIPGATVDVYVNGKALLPNFAPGTLTDPLALDAGSYDVKIVAPGAGADGKAILEQKGLKVPAGANLTLAAHLDASGAPALAAFVNSTAPSAEDGRLTVRHLAAAPAVDVRAGGKAVISGLSNPSEKSLDLPAGTLSVDVVAAGTDTVVLGPADVTVKDGQHLIVYAWGSLDDKTLALATQSVMLKSGSMPDTGVSSTSSLPSLAALTLLAGLAVATVAARRTKALN